MKLTKFSNVLLLGATLAVTATGCKTPPPGTTDLGPPRSAQRPPPPRTEEVVQTPPVIVNPKVETPPVVQRTPSPPIPPGIGSGTPISTTPGVDTTTLTPPIVVVPETNAPAITKVDLNDPHGPNGDIHFGWVPDRDSLHAQTVYFDFDKSTVKGGEQLKINAVADYLRSNPISAILIEGNCDSRGTEEYNRSLGERRALATREVLIKLGIRPERIDTVTFGEDRPAELAQNETAWAKNRRDDFVVLTPPKP